MKRVISFFVVILLVVIATVIVNNKKQDKVTISIGYQVPTAQVWSALIIKNQKLYEYYLKKEFPNTQFEIKWINFTSGPPITANMLAGKVQIGFMGDMPMIVNVSKNKKSAYQSVIIAFDGKGTKGKNQAIMTNSNNDLNIENLAGKKVSTIFGSSAHRMLLEILKKYDLLDKVEVIHQDPNIGMSAVEQNQIAAHATWDPYPRFMKARGKSKYLIDGSESSVDYLAGVVVDRNWLEMNNRYGVSFVKALISAHEIIRLSPEKAARIFQEESKFPYEVCLEEAKNIRWDAEIYNKDVVTLDKDVDFLRSLDKVSDFEIRNFVDAKWLGIATKELNRKALSQEEIKGEWLINREL